MKEYPKYTPGDRVQDLTFDPAPTGTITAAHEKPDAYFVHLDDGANDVVIHARNLRRVD